MKSVAFFETVYGKPAQPGTFAVWPGIDHRLTAATEGTPARIVEFASSPFDRNHDGASLVATGMRTEGAIFIQGLRLDGQFYGSISRMREFSEGGVSEDGTLAPGRRYTLVHRLFFGEDDWCAFAPDLLWEFSRRLSPPMPTVTDEPRKPATLPVRVFPGSSTGQETNAAAEGIAALQRVRAPQDVNLLLSALSRPPQAIPLANLPSSEAFLEMASDAARCLPRRARLLCSFAFGLKSRHDRIGATVAEFAEDMPRGRPLRRSDWDELADAFRNAPEAAGVVEILCSALWRTLFRPYLEDGDETLLTTRVPQDDLAELQARLVVAFWRNTEPTLRRRAIRAYARFQSGIQENDDGQDAITRHVMQHAGQQGEAVLRRHRILFNAQFGDADLYKDGLEDVVALADAIAMRQEIQTPAPRLDVLERYFVLQSLDVLHRFYEHSVYAEALGFEFDTIVPVLGSVLRDTLGNTGASHRRKSILDRGAIASFGKLVARLEICALSSAGTDTEAAKTDMQWQQIDDLANIVSSTISSDDLMGAVNLGWRELLRDAVQSTEPSEIAFWKTRFVDALSKDAASPNAAASLWDAVKGSRGLIFGAQRPNDVTLALRELLREREREAAKRTAHLTRSERSLSLFSGEYEDFEIGLHEDQAPFSSGTDLDPVDQEADGHHPAPPDRLAVRGEQVGNANELTPGDLELIASVEKRANVTGPALLLAWADQSFQGDPPSAPHPQLPDDEADNIISWVLQCAKGSLPKPAAPLVGRLQQMAASYPNAPSLKEFRFLNDAVKTAVARNSSGKNVVSAHLALYLWRLDQSASDPFSLLNPMYPDQDRLLREMDSLTSTLLRDSEGKPAQKKALQQLTRHLKRALANP